MYLGKFTRILYLEIVPHIPLPLEVSLCAFLCHQVLVDVPATMREAYSNLPPKMQNNVKEVIEDPLYTRLSDVATRPGNIHIIVDDYLPLLKYKGTAKSIRNSVSRAMSGKNVIKLQAPLKDLFGQTEWMNRTLERELSEDDVQDKERLKGKASTWVVSADEFLNCIIKADMVHPGVLSGIVGAESIARQQVKEVARTQPAKEVDPTDLIIYFRDMEPSSPKWQLWVHMQRAIFCVMDMKKGGGRREAEYEHESFVKWEPEVRVTASASIFRVLRDALRRDKAWNRLIITCKGHNREAFTVSRLKDNVWEHCDRKIFDRGCQKWMEGVWKVISKCDGVERGDDTASSSSSSSSSNEEEEYEEPMAADVIEAKELPADKPTQKVKKTAPKAAKKRMSVARPDTGGKRPRKDLFPGRYITSDDDDLSPAPPAQTKKRKTKSTPLLSKAMKEPRHKAHQYAMQGPVSTRKRLRLTPK